MAENNKKIEEAQRKLVRILLSVFFPLILLVKDRNKIC